MRDFIISTETNCDLSPAFIKENNICVIPHYYTVEEDVYGAGRELTNKEFYDKMREKHKVGIMHGDCEEDARALQKIIQDKYGYTDFFIEPIGPSIGAHSGPGTLGLVFLGDHR